MEWSSTFADTRSPGVFFTRFIVVIGLASNTSGQTMASPFAFIPEQFRGAWSLLLTAFDYALDSHVDRWQFAVGLSELQSSGATHGHVRRLLLRGLAEHGKETTVPGDRERSFRPLVPTFFPPTPVSSSLPTAPSLCEMLLLNNKIQLHRNDSLHCKITQIVPSHLHIAAETRPRHDSPHPAASLSLPNGTTPLATALQRPRHQALPRSRPEPGLRSWPLFKKKAGPNSLTSLFPPASKSPAAIRATVEIAAIVSLVPLIRFHGDGNGLHIFWDAVAHNQRHRCP